MRRLMRIVLAINGALLWCWALAAQAVLMALCAQSINNIVNSLRSEVG
jgi:hypothetical protein